MNPLKIFWTSVLLLSILSLQGCLHLATGQKGPGPIDAEVREVEKE